MRWARDKGRSHAARESLHWPAAISCRRCQKACYMKEWLQKIWNHQTKADAAVELEEWIQASEASGIRVLIQFARTLRAHRRGILRYYDYRISTGRLEGTNNKIKTLSRSAYGHRNKRYFELRLYALHQSSYKLIG